MRGCFFQRELVVQGTLSGDVRKRGFSLSQVGGSEWESWDAAGALRPIAFSHGPYSSFDALSPPSAEHLTFRDEQSVFQPWTDHAWGHDDYPATSALYTPWQLLIVPDVIDKSRSEVPLEVLLRETGRDAWAESYRWLFQEQYRQWSHLQDWWDPLLRVLVRLQNRYWPLIRGRVHLMHDEAGELFDPEERREFDAAKVCDELGVTVADIADGYRHLARRGYKLEFGDSWYLLRQMAPRSVRLAFEDSARRAQDFYDAAEVLRRFYRDLTGAVLPDAQVVAYAYGEHELAAAIKQREKLFGHQPALTYDADDAKAMLGAIGIYPHGVHVIVEGESEQDLVGGLVAKLLGTAALTDVVLTNLRGVGSATRIEQLLSAVTDYALRTVVIVDNEGDVQAVVDRLVAEGLLDAADVLVQPESLEESNFSDDELVGVAVELAATAGEKRPAATLSLTGTDLRVYHDERLARAGKEKPGLADSLQRLAAREVHGAVRLSKRELAKAILDHLVGEVAGKSREDVDAVAGQRPVLKHLVDRVIKPLADAPRDRPRRRRP